MKISKNLKKKTVPKYLLHSLPNNEFQLVAKHCESTRFLVNEDKQKRCIEMVKPFPQQLYLLAHHFSCKRIFV